jgi:Glycosyl hydrolases family 25
VPDLLLPDFSEFQVNADMGGVAKLNGGAAIIRACYGAARPDKAFARLRAAAASYRFLGIYQYLVAGQDAGVQAQAFLKVVGRLAPHEVAILDLEEGAGDQEPRAAAWLAAVDLAMARPSWLYSGDDFALGHGLEPVFAGPRHTWVAAYGTTEPALGHTLWQCTNGKVGAHVTSWPGAGRCDTSVYHGTIAQLAALIAPGAPAVPVTDHLTTGTDSLTEIAADLDTQPSVILRLTLQANGGTFPLPLAGYINHGSLLAPMAAGIVLRVPA